MLNKFLNQNLLPIPKGNNDHKKEITSADVETIISLIEEYDKNKLGALLYDQSSSALHISIQTGVPKETYVQRDSAVEHQPIIITDSVAPLLEETDEDSSFVMSKNETTESQGAIIKAHMAGSVFLKPAPADPNFVSVGQNVQVGDVLCLLEAMKLFSEVKASKVGSIAKIFVEHGDIVQEGDALFEIL